MVARVSLRRVRPRRAAATVAAAGLLLAVSAAGCGAGSGRTPVVSYASVARPEPSSVPATALPSVPLTPSSNPTPFVGTASPVTADTVAYTWHAGCPVGPDQLSLLHLSYWGFDGHPHVGTMVVNKSVVPDVVKVFESLYRQRFPIRRMQPEDAYGGSDPVSMAADNTSGFNCRNAVAAGAVHWSVHAYGEAIDVNTLENPYIVGGQVMPPAGAAYLDRAAVHPGMAVPGGVLVRAFASVGWQWGGRWTHAPDYQHFSKTGG
jgi:D-alanyl-D-alanine carboxypeptidase